MNSAEEYREDLAYTIYMLQYEGLDDPKDKKLFDLLCEEGDRVK